MNFFRKLFKNIKGSSLVEKILVTAFSVAAGSAIILYMSNVIIESKNMNGDDILSGDFSRNQAIPDSQGTDGIIYTKVGETHYNVTGYNGSSSSIIIPSDHLGLPVKEISSYTFHQRNEITSVVIGSGVSTLGSGCFQNCTYITSLSIPDTVTSIGTYAFSGCMHLSSVTIPKILTRLEECSFYACSLANLNIPSSVTYIGDAAFQHNDFSSLYIPINVTTIGNSPFFDCRNLSRIDCAASSRPSGFNDGWNFSQYGEGGTGIFYDVNWGV